jgi:hypothetical protein
VGKSYTGLDDRLRAFIEKQHVSFVGTPGLRQG